MEIPSKAAKTKGLKGILSSKMSEIGIHNSQLSQYISETFNVF